jgi:3-oxoadipate enol-lactonase/4-carboxymuconolactone decarboxylase
VTLPTFDVSGPPEAPVLVLSNSLGTTRSLWDRQMPQLRQHFRVVRYEHRGHGGAPTPFPGPYQLADLGGDVVEILDHLAVDRASLCGLSLGGMVALWVAANRPERVDRLVLACTATHLPPPDAWRARAQSVRAEGAASLGEALLGRWFTAGFLGRRPDVAGEVRAMLTEVDAEGYAGCCEAIAEADQRGRGTDVGAPTLVIAGAADPVATPAMALALAAEIDGAALTVLPGAAHLANVEQPDRFTAAVVDHLIGTPAERGRAVRRMVLGEAHVARSEADPDPMAADFADVVTRTAWGEVWTRPALDRATRSCVTLAILVVLGRLHELPLHVRGARNNGLREDQILEVVLHSAVYGGVPAANAALAVVRQVLAEEHGTPGDTSGTPGDTSGTPGEISDRWAGAGGAGLG